MRSATLGFISLLVVLSWHAPSHAEPVKKVNCVYPGERLVSALSDFATQLGYVFEPSDYEETLDLDEPIWVLARDVEPELAARIIGASGSVRVKLDSSNRRLTLSDADTDEQISPQTRGFEAGDLCKQFLAYQQRYGKKGAADAPDLLYRPTATEALRDAIEEILMLTEMEGGSGSAVGKRLLYTRDSDDLVNIAELLRLLKSEYGGESSALHLDRRNREALAKLHSDFQPGDGLFSAMLYQLFKDSGLPVYVDAGLMGQFDLEYDVTEVALHAESSHLVALQELAREHYFAVDSVGGALRLHEQDYEGGASYRVFNMDTQLAALEQEYLELKTAEDVLEGFQGDLRSQGGIDVIVDALEVQLDAAGHSPLIRAYGSRLVVVGGVDVIDAAVEVLQALGWSGEQVGKEEAK